MAIDPTKIYTNSIYAELVTKINYPFAQWQRNTYRTGGQLIQNFTLRNNGANILEGCQVKMWSQPEFVLSNTWNIERITAGESYVVQNNSTQLDTGFLWGLSESITGTVHFEWSAPEMEPVRQSYSVELVAPTHWIGDSRHPAELIAAHVLPNDPQVAKILRIAAAELRKAHKNFTIEGYQGNSPRRVAEIAEAIWNAVLTFDISYSEPPASFEEEGQKIRTPSQIIQDGLATCLDTATLFAACLEQAGLHSLIVFADGHAFSGVWLEDKSFDASFVKSDQLLKGVDLQELLFFETTKVAQGQKVLFPAALYPGHSILTTRPRGAVDIYRARFFGVKPIPLINASKTVDDPEDIHYGIGVQNTGWLDQFSDHAANNIANDTKNDATEARDSRLIEWQNKLLDFSLRNPLVNFKRGKKTVTIISPNIETLEDELAAGTRLSVVTPPEEIIMSNDAEGNEMRIAQYAEQAFREREKKLVAEMKDADLQSAMIELMRTGRRDLQEGGANTLFLALGFLRWRDPQSRSKEMNMAPLILVPVSLDRNTARSRIILAGLDEETQFNATLLEMLKQNYGISIPELENDLPRDEHGLDVERIYQLVTSAVRHCEDWLIVRQVALSTFSFARYLMWRDLRNQGAALKENSLVRHLVETPLNSYKSDIPFPVTHELDKRYPPNQLFMPLPADSSQICAALAAASGKDFVMIGPPGTGKSQSIVNMIAHCLAIGKKVLFVSAKKAALDVVYRRMREVGLDDFCLEVHSSKNSNRNAFEQLKRAAARVGEMPLDEDWQRETARISGEMEKLNEYVAHLHRQYPNGLTPYSVMGNLLNAPQMVDIHFSWKNPETHSQEQYAAMRAAAQDITLTFPQAMSKEIRDNLHGVCITDWSPSGEEHFAAITRDCAERLCQFETARRAFFVALSPALSATDIHSTSAACTASLKIAQSLSEHKGQATNVLFADNAVEIKEGINAAEKILQNLRTAWNALSCPYRADAAITLDTNQLEMQWREAAAAIFVKRYFEEKKVVRILQTAAEIGQTPDPARDILTLKQWQTAQTQLEKFAHLAKSTFGLWQGEETNLEALHSGFEKAVQLGKELNASIQQCADEKPVQETLQRALETILQNGDKNSNEMPVYAAAAEYTAAYYRLEPLLKDLANTLNISFRKIADINQNGWIGELAAQCEKWHDATSYLRDWAKWQHGRQAALQLDLAPLIDALESGQIDAKQAPQVFEVNYKRWWLRAVVDQDAILRNFAGREQSFTIQSFVRDVDNYLQLTRQYIRARVANIHQKPQSDGDEKAMGLLRREFRKKMRFKPLRQMIGVASSAILRLTPCMMMSPLSVAQFLALGKQLFDVVIFDEASQIPVWDSIGALARGKQAVIAGDPKQMPPTDFFSRKSDDENEEDDVETIKSTESILEECLSSNVPELRLNWHYRSRSENLIAFSNHHYYDDGLITFPAPHTKDNSVSFHYVANGIYASGKTRTNQNEAKAVVADIVAHLKAPTENDKKTVGVVTFNSQQQRLIEDLLDEARRADPSIEKWFNDAALEPVMVKNLESVQGDERDIMYFSVTYGPTEEGRIWMNFGPLNNDGGERRLNVAITRARCQLKVFSSLRPEQIDLTRTGAIGTQDFKHFLEFAARGTTSFAREANVTGRSFDSSFEEAVASALEARGWKVQPQVGVAKFRIDLGIVHPDLPGTYLAGVECDGATYHSAATARDRDKVREGVLRGLGWNILRVWSTDWWNDPEGIANQLDEELKELHKKPATLKVLSPDNHIALQTPAAPKVLSPSTPHENQSLKLAPNTKAQENQDIAQNSVPQITTYSTTDFTLLEIKPDAVQFYDIDYNENLLQIIAAIIEKEGPILEEVLFKRIARAHNFFRTGDRIQARLQELIRGQFHISPEIPTTVYWPSIEAHRQWNEFREPRITEDARTVDEIPLIELRVLAQIVRLSESDKETILHEMARYCGISRISEHARKRLQMTISSG